MIPIMTLSLLVYFIYIFIDIIIYALGSTSWSFRIFWMVDRVITDPSLGLMGPCEVVPQVLILLSSKAQSAALPPYMPLTGSRRLPYARYMWGSSDAALDHRTTVASRGICVMAYRILTHRTPRTP
jgi:hypothetical protein